MKELFGFKLEVPVEYKNGEAKVERYTLYSEAENPEKTWVELHMGIKGAAIKSHVICFEEDIDKHDYNALKKFAKEITDEYAAGVAVELFELLPDTADKGDEVEWE